MKFTLITLTSVAVLLGIITYFALFSGPQIVQPNPASSSTSPNAQVAQTSPQPTSTATSSAFVNVGSSTTVQTIANQTVYQTIFSAPYPITWFEGQPQFSIMSATLQANQLVLGVNIQMGNTAQCVPVNLRLITDEQGDMAAPTTPAAPDFPLAPDGTCQGDPETAYNESVTFTVGSVGAPWLISTGDPANGFFEIATTTAGGLQVTVPQKSG